LFRNVFSKSCQTKQDCVSSGMVLFASTIATRAADGGISPSIVSSASILCQLMVWFTWYMEMAPKRTCTACDKSKESAREFPRALCAWDSGSVIVMATELLTPTRAGIQFPGSSSKKYLPLNLKS